MTLNKFWYVLQTKVDIVIYWSPFKVVIFGVLTLTCGDRPCKQWAKLPKDSSVYNIGFVRENWMKMKTWRRRSSLQKLESYILYSVFWDFVICIFHFYLVKTRRRMLGKLCRSWNQAFCILYFVFDEKKEEEGEVGVCRSWNQMSSLFLPQQHQAALWGEPTEF